MIYYDHIPRTLAGNVFIAASERGLCAVSVGKKTAVAFRKELSRMFPGEKFEGDPARLARYRRELEEYLRGTRKRFTVPIDLTAVHGSFRRKVLEKLYALPFGRVVTYGELAARSGSPGAARAVGTAMSTNPLAIVVPCHRVVASSGGIGGYSAGLALKRKLLVHEGVPPTRAGLIEAGRGFSR